MTLGDSHTLLGKGNNADGGREVQHSAGDVKFPPGMTLKQIKQGGRVIKLVTDGDDAAWKHFLGADAKPAATA